VQRRSQARDKPGLQWSAAGIWINTHGAMATEMPHGDMKNSVYGSDLSMQSLPDYTQVRHLVMAS
jgi:acyl-CoA reductase-like NAD-dependent aldehyde dehydrogenase